MILTKIRNNPDDSRVFSVTDLSTGQTVSMSSVDYGDFDDRVSRVNEAISNGAGFDEVIEEITYDDSNDVRERAGISPGPDGGVIIDGRTYPKAFCETFRNLKTDNDVDRLKAFIGLLDRNPYPYCAEALIDWIGNNKSLEILDDGRIRGYRGVNDELLSSHSGFGIINGVEINGRHDNTPGNIIEFPRELVDHSSDACSIGLHVGTADYASGFGTRYVTVAFSPADVVSPPSSSTSFKIRVCRMEVLEEISHEQIRKEATDD